MAYDTKYRPLTFQDVIGQDIIVSTLKGFVLSSTGFNQSYIISGPYGTGKTTLARIFARALLCESPVNGDCCNNCKSCKNILQSKDDTIIEIDSATNSGKDEIKKIIEDSQYASLGGRRKIFILDEAHQLSKSASDALLKPLEEDIPGTESKKLICIFCTTERQKIKKPITSRCAMFNLTPVSYEDIAFRLAYVCQQEGKKYDMPGLLYIANRSEKHVRDALKTLEIVSNTGDITEENVKSYYGTDKVIQLVQILMSLKVELKIEQIYDLLVSFSPFDICGMASRVLSAAYIFRKANMNISKEVDIQTLRSICSSIDDNDLVSMLEFFNKKSKSLDESMFICDLLILKDTLHTTPQLPVFHPTPAYESNPSHPSPTPPPVPPQKNVKNTTTFSVGFDQEEKLRERVELKKKEIREELGNITYRSDESLLGPKGLTKSGVYVVPSAIKPKSSIPPKTPSLEQRKQTPEIIEPKVEELKVSEPSISEGSKEILSSEDIAKSINDRFLLICQQQNQQNEQS